MMGELNSKLRLLNSEDSFIKALCLCSHSGSYPQVTRDKGSYSRAIFMTDKLAVELSLFFSAFCAKL